MFNTPYIQDSLVALVALQETKRGLCDTARLTERCTAMGPRRPAVLLGGGGAKRVLIGKIIVLIAISIL